MNEKGVIHILARANLLALWKRRIRVWDFALTPPSLDRFAALLLHKVNLLGKQERHFFEKNVKPGMNVVDVGANQGLYSLLFARLIGPDGLAIAVEPEPDMFAALEKNIAANSVTNIEAHQLALGSRPGDATLSRSLIHGGDSRLSSGHASEISVKKTVRVVTLDELTGERKVDFVKMDIQGWEWHALRGMKETLKRNRDIKIHFEFWPFGLRDAGCEPATLLQYLSEQGFGIFRIDAPSEAQVRDFSALLKKLPGKRFMNLYARR